MRKSKHRYFYHIFVSPGDASGAITLNVVWMERVLDAYKLFRCMYPSNYNRFWDRARYWSKIVIFSYPPCIRRPRYRSSRRNSATPFGMEKLEWLGYPRWKNFEDIFICFGATHERDGQTDTGWRHTPRFCIASRGKKYPIRMKSSDEIASEMLILTA